MGGAAGAAGAATWCCGCTPSGWRAVIDANGVTDLLVAALDGGEVEDDDDAAVLHGVADELVQPDDAELLQLPPQHPARMSECSSQVDRPACDLGRGRGEGRGVIGRRRQGDGSPRTCPESIIVLRFVASMACIRCVPSEMTRR